jgi:hypothetical protein
MTEAIFVLPKYPHGLRLSRDLDSLRLWPPLFSSPSNSPQGLRLSKAVATSIFASSRFSLETPGTPSNLALSSPRTQFSWAGG